MNQEATAGVPLRSTTLVDVAGMATFVAVIQAASFTGAARRLVTSKSVVSRRIADMEHQLGARLIDRTAARVHPTEVGAVYFAKCVRILESIESANDFVAGFHGGLRGDIRVSVPHAFSASVLSQILVRFASLYPELKVEIELDDREDAAPDAGFDVAIRVGRLADSSMLARTLSTTRMWVCASPEYLRRCGTPVAPDDLARHDCLMHSGFEVRSGWYLRSESQTYIVRGRERMRSACYLQLLQAAKADLGIGLLPEYLIADAVAAGDLAVVLADYAPSPLPISAVYPPSRKASQKVQALIGFLAENLSDPAPWELKFDTARAKAR